jgi:hypothetical protein
MATERLLPHYVDNSEGGIIHLRPANSTTRIVLYCLVASSSVLLVALVLEWLVYADLLHRTGPLRVVGTTIAAVVTFAFVLQWQLGLRRRHSEALRRLRLIAEFNDQIRNAMQAVACVTYATDPNAAEAIRQAVEKIDLALRGVVAESKPPTSAVSPKTFSKTA